MKKKMNSSVRTGPNGSLLNHKDVGETAVPGPPAAAPPPPDNLGMTVETSSQARLPTAAEFEEAATAADPPTTEQSLGSIIANHSAAASTEK